MRDTLNLIHDLAARGVGIRNLADAIIDSSHPDDLRRAPARHRGPIFPGVVRHEALFVPPVEVPVQPVEVPVRCRENGLAFGRPRDSQPVIVRGPTPATAAAPAMSTQTRRPGKAAAAA